MNSLEVLKVRRLLNASFQMGVNNSKNFNNWLNEVMYPIENESYFFEDVVE